MKRSMAVMVACLAVLCLMFSVVACGDGETVTTAPASSVPDGGSSDSTSPVSSDSASGEPIKVGICASLTGSGAAPSQMLMMGVQYGVDEVNAAGGINGRPVELVPEDDASSVPNVVPSMNKLIEGQKVAAVMGAISNPHYYAARTVAESAGVPFVSWATPMAVGREEDVLKYCFTTSQDAVEKGVAVLQIIKHVGAKNVFAAADLEPTYTDSLKYAQAEAEKLGIKFTLLPDTWDNTQADYSAVIQKLYANYQSLSPDLMVVLAVPTDTPPILKGLHDLGVECPVVMDGVNAMPIALFANGTDPVQGTLFPSPGCLDPYAVPDGTPGKELWTKFYDGFKAKSGDAPSLPTCFGYDGWLVLQEGLKAGGSDREKIRDGIEALKDFQGMQTRFSYSAEDHMGAYGGFFLWEVVGDQFKFVAPLG